MTMTSSGLTIRGSELGTQLMVSKHRPDPNRFIPASFSEDSGYRNKPTGGMWTSTLEDGISDWVRWCRAEEFGDVDSAPWWRLTPAPTAQLLQIDTMSDLMIIMNSFGRDMAFDWTPKRRSLDFNAMIGAGYSGLHLTKDGAANCHFGDWQCGLSLNAWDCESTVWLRWSFVNVVAAPMQVMEAMP